MIRRLLRAHLAALAIAFTAAGAAGAYGAEQAGPGEALQRALSWIGSRRAGGGAPAGAKRSLASSARRGRKGVALKGAPTGEVKTLSAGGSAVAHIVPLEGGGFVAMSAGPNGSEVLGFSASGTVDSIEAGSPFAALLGADPSSTLELERTLFAASPNPVTDVDAIDDLRVAPLVESKWDQQDVSGKKTYNYYTTNSYCCGCVATAMAQLMRYHRFPSASVAPQTFTCYVGTQATEVATKLSLVGGVYDWDLMPLVPDGSISDTEREMIGRICYDAGVSMRMHYGFNGDESGAYSGFEFDPLVNVFGYENARSYCLYDYNTIPDSVITNAILANLDASCPVLLGIMTGGVAGHAIVADGYGFVDGELYCHLNMGWSGFCDYWYRLPDIPLGSGTFKYIVSVVYNIFPEATGELVTGRVLYPDGSPASGAGVNAQLVYREKSSPGSSKWMTVTNSVDAVADANGIFAVYAPTGCTVTLSSALGDWATTNLYTATLASNIPSRHSFTTGTFSYSSPASPRVGNSWGNDLTLFAKPEVVSFGRGIDPASGEDGFLLTFEGTAGVNYIVEWREALERGDWSLYAEMAVPDGGIAELAIPIDPEKDSCFYRIRSP